MHVWSQILVLSHTVFFFFNDTATTEIYTLSLHDALPIYQAASLRHTATASRGRAGGARRAPQPRQYSWYGASAEPHFWQSRSDRKSTRLNSSHANISYAVFCLKKKKVSFSIEINVK